MYADVVGDLVRLDDERVVVLTRRGAVEVPLDSVAIAKPAPPSVADELALEATVAAGWRAARTGRVGGWLLRANHGFTARANSVLPLAAPGMPLDDALAAAHDWYAERGLPLLVQIPLAARRLLDAQLTERGWAVPATDVHVLAARLDMLAAPASNVEVTMRDAPDDGWLARYRSGIPPRGVARALLSRHDRVGFAAVRVDGRTVAIGRGTVDDGWLGVTAVEVGPEHRRAGLASAVMVALWRWGAALGAERTHLEVSSDNTAALGLYRRLGYWRHHDYRYRAEP